MFTKRIIAASAICLIIMASFVIPYTSVTVYAETETQEEEFYEIGSDSKSLAAAIQAYVNARNVWFLSDNSKAFIAWVTNEIEKDQADLAILSHNIFSTINRINPVTGTILKFQYKTNAISILNKYFNEWRNKYGLSTEEGKTAKVYSGEVFTDLDGYSCLVFYLNGIDPNSYPNYNGYPYQSTYISKYGSNLKYRFYLNDYLNVTTRLDFNLTDKTSKRIFVRGGTNTNSFSINEVNENATSVNPYFITSKCFYRNNIKYVEGGYSVAKSLTNNKYYFASYSLYNDEFTKQQWNNGYDNCCRFALEEIDANTDPADVDIHTPTYPQDLPDDDVTIQPKNKTTNKSFSVNDSFNDYSKVINNYIDNSVTNNTTSIVNPTDEPEEPDPEPEPSLPDEDGIWSEPNDEGGYNYHWDAPSGLPDFNFTLPVQLERKFPFCMPFDLLAIFTIFNGEPETPTLEGQIHLGFGNWQYVWDLSTLDVDLHDFDSTMEKVRTVERLGFLIALTFLTMRLFSTAY